MLSILYGLSSALAWGAADFCGGLASRRTRPSLAVLYGEAVGLVALLIGAFASGEPLISARAWLMCAFGGGLGVIGLLLFFISMSRGQMSVAAPVTALMAAALPVAVGVFMEGFPGWLTVIGFILALAAIWFISQPDGTSKSLRLRLADLSLPLLAGITFGVYLILMNRGSQGALFWPMVASRSAGVGVMLVYVLVARQLALPPRSSWLLLVLNGLLDITGNAFYVLAGNAGRMDVAAVLASLYPGSTVLLASLLLRERINRLQFIGILAALIAIVLLML